MIGERFGDFVIKHKLAEGGGGTVYLAEQSTLGRDVALKVVVGAEASTTTRFLREVRIAAALDHPYAAHVYAFGAEPDHRMWIAMELVRGISLDRMLAERGPIPLARFVPFFDRLCEVLAAAHEQGIVHRDIKPANVMVLNRSGRLLPKLLDLGIARVAGDPIGVEAESVDELALDMAKLRATDSMQITRAGALVGTPHYIAPEQWVRASRVDQRADIYSLTLLAFECLTNEKPFTGATPLDLARAHARTPLPALGDAFPADLSAVLARGAAKRADDRFATTLELATAVRQASHLGLEPSQLPQLSEALRDNWLHHAPQPIAESIELWDTARAPRQALDAMVQVANALAHYLGVLAIAARLRVGSTPPSEVAAALLVRLRDGRLELAEWLQLAKELAQPFASGPSAHPLPELVELCTGSGFEHVEKLGPAIATARAAPDDALEVPLEQLAARLGRALELMTFVFDYQLVVCGATTTVWMGPRRATRAVGPPFANDHAVRLLDADGAEVLVLDPVVQCQSPSAGAPDELFLLDGGGRDGARLVTLPTMFERRDDRLWEGLAERGLVTSAQASSAATIESPYKGLATFRTADADNYFGRERESEAFANRLRAGRFLAVVGPSGTGKSSFVLAGVLPRLPATFRPITLRPTAQPRTALASALRDAGITPPSDASPTAWADAFVTAVPADTTYVLVVDQFEELVTSCSDADERIAFGSILMAIAHHPRNCARVVVTLRDDFLIAIQQLSPFVETLSSSLQLLGTPQPEDLERVVTEPARRAGYTFDESELPARMVREVKDQPGALALLSFTASKLWELRDRDLRSMRVRTYTALGGVIGALAHHSEATLAAMSDDERPLVRELFRHLVTAQGTRATLSKREADELLGSSALGRSVIEALVAARLIVSSENAATGDSIEIIHEALIAAWPRLVGWQREDAESVRLRDSLRASARQWNERGRPAGLLWRKESLAEYRIWRPRFPGRLTELETEFATASLREEARARRLRRLAIAMVVASLAVGLGVAVRSWLVQKHRLVENWKQQARTAMMDGRPIDGLLYADAAMRGGGSSPALDQMLGAAAQILAGSEHYVGTISRRAQLVHASRDGKLVLGFGEGEAALFDTTHVLKSWDLPCYDGAFSPDGKHAVLVCTDRTLRLVELDTLAITERPVATDLDVRVEASDAGFAPIVDGDVSTAYDWNGTPQFTVSAPGADLLRMVFAPGGGAIVISGSFEHRTSTFEGVLAVDATGKQTWSVPHLPAPARIAAFSARGDLIALALLDHSVTMLDREGHVVWTASYHHSYIRTLAFDSTGERLLTTGEDGSSYIVEARTGKSLATLPAMRGQVIAGAWLPGDREVVIGTDTGTILRVDASAGQVLWRYVGHTGIVRAIDVIPATRELVSTASDGAVWRWPIDRTFATTVDAQTVAIWSKPGLTATVSQTEARAPGFVVPLAPLHVDKPEIAPLDVTATALAIAYQRDVSLFVAGGSGPAWTRHVDAQISSVAISPDGTLVAVVSAGTALVRDRAGKDIARIEIHSDSVVFDRAGRLVAVTDTGELRTYAPTTGAIEHRVAAHVGVGKIVPTSLPGVFATIGYDEDVHVWSDSDWTKRHTLHVGQTPNAVVIDPTGSFLAVIDSTPEIRTYDLATGEPLHEALLPVAAISASATPEGDGVLAALPTGLVRVTTFFARPSRDDLERLERCRTAKRLDGELLVAQTPDCASR